MQTQKPFAFILSLTQVNHLLFFLKELSMKNKIHILGASGSGTTTLGKEISEKWGHTHLDSDD